MNPQDIMDAIIEQRNDALNKLAVATAEAAQLRRQLAELQEQLASDDKKKK